MGLLISPYPAMPIRSSKSVGGSKTHPKNHVILSEVSCLKFLQHKLIVFSMKLFIFTSYSKWRRSQVVRQGSAKPLFTGSNPVVASPSNAEVVELADTRDLKSLGI
jgi:hypothetical protein